MIVAGVVVFVPPAVDVVVFVVATVLHVDVTAQRTASEREPGGREKDAGGDGPSIGAHLVGEYDGSRPVGRDGRQAAGFRVRG